MPGNELMNLDNEIGRIGIMRVMRSCFLRLPVHTLMGADIIV